MTDSCLDSPSAEALSAEKLSSYWMPFTANRDFKQSPRLINGAQGHYYTSADGRQLYDAFSGLWTSGLGHCHPKIVAAVQQQVATLDYSMSFQMGHDAVFTLSEQLTAMAPKGINHAFYTSSGSESVDTALKIALAYHRANGDASRTVLVGRQRGYHGVNFGGISVGGMMPNREAFNANLIPGVQHLPHSYNHTQQAFSHGQPAWGEHLADALEDICLLQGPDNIAAVIVEPVAGSTGILPPPIGYLKRLRDICDRYGVLLIFDEVITAFYRVGHAFAADRFGVTPDIITTAKGLTNGVIPMGAVLVSDKIYNTFMQTPKQGVELFHGYTYSGHPVAAAAALASLALYQEEGIAEQTQALEPLFAAAIHSLDSHPKVKDVRNIGLMGAIELEPRQGAPGARGMDAHKRCFWEEDLVIRNGVDTLQFAPFLNSKPDDIEKTFETIKRVIDRLE